MRRITLCLMFGATLFAACNRGGGITAVPGGFPPSSSPAEVSSSSQVVKVTALPVQIAAGGSANAVVRLSIMPGYHINANPATFSYLIATEVTPGKLEGVATSKPTYPAASEKKFQFAEKPLAVYEGEADIKMALQADPKVATGALPITVRVQACDNEKCFPPATLNATVSVEVK